MKRIVITLSMAVAIATTSFANSTNPIKVDSYRVEVTNIKKTSPFCLAVAKGDFETVKKMIELGENVNQVSNEKTPLMYAARYNHMEIAKLLVANGAEIKVKDKRGMDAIKYAEVSNAQETATVLKQLKSQND